MEDIRTATVRVRRSMIHLPNISSDTSVQVNRKFFTHTMINFVKFLRHSKNMISMDTTEFDQN